MTTGRSAASDRFAFRAVTRADLPLLRRWRGAPHVSEWWGDPGDLEAEYITTTDPVRYFIALRDDRLVGLVQSYHWSDFPSEARVIGAGPDEDGMDYFLGEPELIGRGIGSAMLSAFLAQVVRTDPGINGVRLDVSEANRRSRRCLEKLGFQRTLEGVSIAGEPGPHCVYALRFPPGNAS